MRNLRRCVGLIALVWLIGSCGGGDAVVGPPPPPTVATVTVSVDGGTLVPAATMQLSATAKSVSGEILDRAFSWSTSDPAKATVSTAGLVTGAAPGVATITAAVDGKSSSATITVLDGGVVSASGATLSTQSGAVQLVVPPDAVATQTSLTVVASTAYANDPRVVRGTAFDYGPSGLAFKTPVSLRVKYDVANVPAGTEQGALKLHLSTGSAWEPLTSSVVDTVAKTVSGEVSHFSTYAVIIPAPVAAISIRGPPDAPIGSPLQVGVTEQLTAVLTDSQSQVLTDRAVNWTSSDPAAASITAGGLLTAHAPGSSTISASAGGVTASLVLTITPIPVASVSVSLVTSSLTVGGTTLVSATTYDASNNVLSGRSIEWSSSNMSVATVSSSGSVNAVAAGSATITGTSEGKSGSATVTVSPVPVATVSVSLAMSSVMAGQVTQATATVRDPAGNVLTDRVIAWTSDDPAVATVSATGSVTAVAPGSTPIRGTTGGQAGVATLTVTPVPVASLALSTLTNPIRLGQTQQLTGTPRDAAGLSLSGRTVNWISSDPAVLSLSASSSVSTPSGAIVNVTATGIGAALITASSESAASASTPVIRVDRVPVASVSVNPPTVNLIVGISPTRQLTATTSDGSGGLLSGRVVTWSSSQPAIASVDANGLVTAVEAGTTTITASSEGKSGTAAISVSVAPVATVAVSLTPGSITAVGSAQATETTLDANGGVLTGRAVTWSSSNTGIATVDTQGVVTAIAVGTTTITATAVTEGKSGSAQLTVTQAPVATITLSLAASSIISGQTTQATATLVDSRGRALTSRTVDWSTDAPGVATVSASGLIIAVSPGVATIAAVSETRIATAIITVSPIPVASVAVSLALGSVIAGATTQASATTFDANGAQLTGRSVTWTSSNASVATVSSGGLVTSVGTGLAQIIATSETKSGQATLTVTPVPVATVSISPATADVIVGSTRQLTATTKDASGTPLTGRGVTWSSTDNTIATVDPNGLVTTRALGSASINATSEGKSGTSSITVIPVPVASVTVSLTSNSITAVGTSQAMAITLDANGGVLTGRAITWSSSATVVATVSPQGVVSPVAVGTATIIATSEGRVGSAVLSVTQAPVASVTVSPPSATVLQGTSDQLTVVLRDAHQNVVTRPVIWSSSTPGVATVSASGLVTAASNTMGTTTIAATSEGQIGTSLITVSQVPIASISVAFSAGTINIGQTTQATATLRDAGNNVLTGRTVTWTSDDFNVATVTGTGVVTALAAGSAHITAASGGQTGSAALTVTPIPVASVSVTLAASPIQIGQTTQATATALDANNNVLSGRVIVWSSANTAVAAVSPGGLVTAIAAGSASIIGTTEGKSGSLSLIVIPVPVAALTVSAPITPMVLGQTQQLTATPKDASSNTLTGRTVNWVSSDPAILSVSSPSSLSTLSGATVTVSAAGVGTAIITAASESAPSVATPVIAVNPIPVASVTVSPASASLVLGITATQQFTATVKDANTNVLNGRVVTWTSSNPAVATVDANGFVTAVGGGSTVATATSESKTGTASVTVTVPVAAVAVNPSSATLTVGLTHQLIATVTDINNNSLSGRVVTWSSSDPTRASVSSTGLVSAVAAGTAVITATSEGKIGTSSITITPTPVASVSASLSLATIQAGQTSQATATTFDASNNILSGRVVTWSSGNDAVATVSSAGLVTAVAAGVTTIIATSEGKSGSAIITVTPVPVASVTVSPPSATIIAGATQQLSAATRDANNVVVTDRVVIWSSSNPAIATVSSVGVVTAASVGSATITATSEGKNGTSSITVVPVPVASVTVALSPNSITAVGTSRATAITLDANGGTLNGRAVAWSSGNAGVATVTAQGLVTAVAVGTTIITGTSEGKTGDATLTVTQAPVATVTVIPPDATVVQGGTEQLSVVLKDAHENVLTRPVVWSSNNDPVASVSQTGVVTANSPGTATITASSELQSGTASVSVSAIPVSTVSVTLAASTITDAQTTQATATVRDANGNVLTGRTITWSSDKTSVATVSITGGVTPVAPGSTQIRATSGGQTGSTAITVIPRVAAMIVSPPSANVVIGSSLQLVAEARDANNNILSGRAVSWSSDAPSIAAVSASGVATSVGVGSATITATSEGTTGTSSITIVPVPVALVTVSMASTSITVGQTTQATATARDASGNILMGRAVTWSSGNTALATVSQAGVVTAVGAGSVQIIGMSEGKTGSATLTVNPPPVANVTVALSPGSITAVGISQATATTLDANGAVLSGRLITWTSGDGAVATVDAQGLVAAVAVGTTSITATSEGRSGNATIMVTQAPVATVTVSLASGSINIAQTTQASATLLDSKGRVLTGRALLWSSDNTGVATVGPSTGLVGAVSAGTANVIATSEGKTGSAPLTVTPAPVASVTVSPATASLVLGIASAQQLTAVTRDANGNILSGRQLTWTSSNSAVAAVDTVGSVTAVGPGSATITATSEGKTGTSSVTVSLAPVATVTVALAATSITAVGTSQATATSLDANGKTLNGRAITWSSSNTTVASVNLTTGLVTGVTVGTANIMATSEGKTGTATLTVTPALVATVTVSAPTTPMIAGGSQHLTATMKDANGNVLTGRSVTWVSSNTAVLTVGASGSPATVTAVGAGTATITATSESVSSIPTPTITVNPIPVTIVTLSAPVTPMVVGGTQVLTATPKDSSSNALSGRTVNWISSNPAILSLSAVSSLSTSSGATVTITATGVGAATISASSETAPSATTSNIDVNPAPVAAVTISAPTTPMVVGGMQQLTATTRDGSGNILTGRTVGWLSSNTAVLTVSPLSGPSGTPVTLTAVGAGAATITATSGLVSSTPTPTITVNTAVTTGPLRVSTVNPRYFADPSGRIVYLTGSHYWKNVQDDGPTDPPSAFDNAAYLNFLQRHNHNFTRLWVWEQSRWSAETSLSHWFSPTLYVRTGPGVGTDGGSKFDLNQINPEYLARLRQRVIDAGARGIYVSVMLFDGWSVGIKGNSTAANPWLAHPFNSANNVNGINGDTNGDNNGVEIQTLSVPAITALQDAYVRAVIDAVNDLDNVIYEISNESDPSGDPWQYHMISLIRSYEAGKSKQHPIGMTIPYPGASNAEVLSSGADWVSINGDINNPIVADGSKVSLLDTDHLCGICGTAAWPWMSLMRGHNTLLMDGYDGSPGVGDPVYNPADPLWEIVRTYMGYARSYALRMDLAQARPHGELSSSGDCLAVVGREYLVLLPVGGTVTVNLTGVSGSRSVEWFQPRTNQTIAGPSVTGGTSVTFTAPFSGGNLAILYIHP